MRSLLALTILAAASYGLMSEEALLEINGDRVFRPEPGVLCIIAGSGDTLVFADSGNDIEYAEELSTYRLVDYLPGQEFWVLEVYGYEWVDWRLVNAATGAVDTTISTPVPSPDGKRLFCHMEDISAGFIPNGIQVWRVDPDGLTLEFEDVTVPWGPINGSWDGDSTIVFEKMYYDPETWDVLTRPGRLELNSEGTWVPDDPEDWKYGD